MTQLFSKINQLHEFLASRQALSLTATGLIPTMGALHQGHLSLIQRSLAQDQTTIVSIFVNPIQFAPGEDFERYPRQLEQDLALCQQAGVDAVFAPDAQEIFGENWVDSSQKTLIHPPAAITEVLCGRSRPGHFVGVATLVTKLLNIVQPQHAYFGQKDAQQVAVIKSLVKDLNLPVEIISCPIARDKQGLALSSRNQHLTEAQRIVAPQIFASLQAAQSVFINDQKDSDCLCQIVINYLANLPELKLDYLQVVDPHTMQSISSIAHSGLLAIAVYLGKIRLIDNILLTNQI